MDGKMIQLATVCAFAISLASTGPIFAAQAGPKGKPAAKTTSPRELVQSDRVLIIGHRGASAYAPENTLASFKLAVQQKADMVEDDFYATKDGKMIAIHDSTLDRTTDACKKWGGKKILVRSKTLAELQELDAGSWKDPKFAGERLPTNQAATLAILQGSVPLLERKGGTPEQTLEDLKAIDAVEKVVVQAFDWKYLRELHQLEPKIVLGALGGGEITNPKIRVIKKTGASAIGWDHKDLTEESIQRVHAAGLKAWAYTVDDEAEMKRLIAAGIDGIISNKPDVARKVVESVKGR
ncbi:MAG: hypothetical protein JXQ73_26840 [Phycisphaerae bacterium]|nr:hypothetical protein [Phycisphaerae bacterium]